MRSYGVLLAAILSLSTCGGNLAPAFGIWKPQYANADPALQEWYGNAKVTPEAYKRLGFEGCCDKSEVVRTQFRVDKSTSADQWWYLDGAVWKQVPPDIIHWDVTSPDSRPVLFVLDHAIGDLPAGTPTCFYPPGGGG